MQAFIDWQEITKTELRMLKDKGNMWPCMHSAVSLFSFLPGQRTQNFNVFLEALNLLTTLDFLRPCFLRNAELSYIVPMRIVMSLYQGAHAMVHVKTVDRHEICMSWFPPCLLMAFSGELLYKHVLFAMHSPYNVLPMLSGWCQVMNINGLSDKVKLIAMLDSSHLLKPEDPFV